MKRNFLIVALTVMLLTGFTYTTYMFSQQNSFFSKFSLRELVEKNKALLAGLDCSSGGGSAGMGAGGGSGSREFHSHKTENFSCQVKTDSAEEFDEAGLISALKQDIENDILNSGAKVVESGNPETNSFYFEYSSENIEGRVELSGKKTKDYYTLKADLDEKGKK
ncbi:MAG: hypothetical protein M3033_19720 [Acidobacteriota bacterium]|nr:hypothetical protein [Acidobacteriota bacterium]